MKQRCRAALLAGLAWVLLLAGCGDKKSPEPAKETSLEQSAISEPKQLPNRYQKPAYLAESPSADLGTGGAADVLDVKVGANITSTRGPQPLWNVLKRLAKLKNMNISWSSDVDQKLLVDVDIRAEDNFFAAIDNLLRQVDYFHEMQGNTIIVRYKDTKQFHIALPHLKNHYINAVGGNFLGTNLATSKTTTEGTIKIESKENEFNIWKNIEINLIHILNTGASKDSRKREQEIRAETAKLAAEELKNAAPQETRRETIREVDPKTGTVVSSTQTVANKPVVSKEGIPSLIEPETASYTIDKHIGIITVTAPPRLIAKVEDYVNRLQKEMFRQVAIEAKILEVYLQDNSRIGLDWTKALKNTVITGTVNFGAGGQVYPWIPSTSPTEESTTRFVSKVSVNAFDFTTMLNALEEQGDTKILANPKLTVLNGQPAVISVGKNISYIESITGTENPVTGAVTYTVKVDRVVEGVALGVVPSIIDKKTVVMHLTPITTDLIDDEIPYETFGNNLKVGLPKVGIKEMSTMVQVGNGEMLIIGGLIDKIEGKTSNMLPGVSKIPLVKYLFGFEEKIMQRRELVILLTPKII
ncbi:MAG: pilus (MSHA type) biogenesis protein MshL [Desulfobulbaceae bacterium A2]|nr:MAG: pilus (MSHA type) biogenesis protein MshL [Desulfobulbaceae bacterium A2]